MLSGGAFIFRTRSSSLHLHCVIALNVYLVDEQMIWGHWQSVQINNKTNSESNDKRKPICVQIIPHDVHYLFKFFQ